MHLVRSLVTEAENQIPHFNSARLKAARPARLCRSLVLRRGCYRSSGKHAVSRQGEAPLTVSKDPRGVGSRCDGYLSTESFFTILQGLFLMVEISFFFCSTSSISIASSSSDSDSSSDEWEEAEEVLGEAQNRGHEIEKLTGVRGKVLPGVGTVPVAAGPHSGVGTVPHHAPPRCDASTAPLRSGQGCSRPG